MPSASTAESAEPAAGRLRVMLTGLALVLAVAAVYANATSGPFVFDDTPTIVENPTLRQLGTSMTPPGNGMPVTGRPIANLSFAVNHALGGLNPRGYHVGNLLLHALNALLVFGLVRQTLGRVQQRLVGEMRSRYSPGTVIVFAGSIALLWAVHPLTTAAVSYISQRTEVLMALFFLGTLYAFARSFDARHPKGWLVVSAAACWLGMGTKEVMVSAPVLALLYDRTFVAGGFGAALRARWAYYLVVAASWLWLVVLTLGNDGRGGTAGFAIGITSWTYALTQCEALVHYLTLVFWPSPLVFDYGGTRLITDPVQVLPQAGLLIALAAATAWALWRRPVVGFLGAACFAILAPTSSFVPVADTVFEHRMYLPLVALLALGAAGVFRLAGRWAWMGVPILVVPLGMATLERNSDYRNEVTLWADTVAKRPDNVRAHYTLGVVLSAEGRLDEAIRAFEAALRLDPKAGPAHNGLAGVQVKLGRFEQAIASYAAALRLSPSAEAHNNLANVLLRLGRVDEARRHYGSALALRPTLGDAHNNLGNLLAQAGEFTAAEEHYRRAIELRPDLADAHANLGNVLAQTGRAGEAIPHYKEAIRVRPQFAHAHYNLGIALSQEGRWAEAVSELEMVLTIEPRYPGARQALEHARTAREVLGR